MNFLYPTFLFALFAILIPIIIHLFNFRTYKTVYFSNVKFLKDIKQETKSKSTLKHLLVLLSRILAIAALVFAFAQPYIPNKNTNKAENTKQTAIYIDNSFSTEAESKYGKISEIAKKKALQIVDAYSENTKFYFLTNDFKQKHQHFVLKEQVKEFIQNTKVSPTVKNITEVINKAKDFLTANNNKVNKVYIISDFQKTSSNLKKLENDSNLNVVLVPLKAENINNLFIDSVWFETPSRTLSQTDEISVKITNKADESYSEMPINLYLNDTIKATGSYNIEARESIVTKLNFTNNKTGIIKGKLEITDFPITYDNTFYFNFDINEQTKILIISNKKNRYIDNVFSNTSKLNITYKTPNLVNYENINEYNVIISNEIKNFSNTFTQAMYSYISDGGVFICFPTINLNIQSYNKFFNKLKLNYITGIDTSKIYAGRINYNSVIFRNVFKKKDKNIDMPYVLERIKFSTQTSSNETVILYSEKNDKLISSANIGLGKLYIFSQPASKKAGNLVLHPLWAPLIYNMVFYRNNTQDISYTIGKDQIVSFVNKSKEKDKTVHLINKDNIFDIIPQIFNSESSKSKIFLNNEVKLAGHYFISYNNKKIKGLSFNYDRKESDLSHFSIKEIKESIEEKSLSNFSIMNQNDELFSKIIKEQSIGKQLWKLFIVLALLFLLLEIILIRFLK